MMPISLSCSVTGSWRNPPAAIRSPAFASVSCGFTQTGFRVIQLVICISMLRGGLRTTFANLLPKINQLSRAPFPIFGAGGGIRGRLDRMHLFSLLTIFHRELRVFRSQNVPEPSKKRVCKRSFSKLPAQQNRESFQIGGDGEAGSVSAESRQI